MKVEKEDFFLKKILEIKENEENWIGNKKKKKKEKEKRSPSNFIVNILSLDLRTSN